MLEDVKYLKYNYNTRNLVNMFYKILFEWRKEQIINVLERYSKLIGNAVNEEMRCYFASEFTQDDEEYFGDTGVAFYFDYPAVDEDCIIILSNKQFFDEIKERCINYLNIDKSNENEILNLLKEIERKLQ